MVPQITTPPRPLLPRQTVDPDDPYGLSSLYDELSTMYPDLYSYSYDYSSAMESYSDVIASLMSEYPSLYPSYTYNPIFTTGTAEPRVTSAHSNPTATAIPVGGNGNGSGGKSGGLSNSAKIGIGVAVPLVVLLLAALGFFLWYAGKRKGKKSSTTIVAPAAQLQSPPPQFLQPQMYAQNQGYIPGFQQQQQTPPPHYIQPQPQDGNELAEYGGYAKGPGPGVVELEQEYHFARPGAVELGDGTSISPGENEEGTKAKKSRFWRSGEESGK